MTGALGALLFAVGLYAVLGAETARWLRFGGGSVLLLLGAEAVRAAIRSRQSLLSRIGPLP